MNGSTFSESSGFSATWLNHLLICVSGTVLVITASIIVGMLVHKISENEQMGNVSFVSHLLMVISVLFLILGILSSFWF